MPVVHTGRRRHNTYVANYLNSNKHLIVKPHFFLLLYPWRMNVRTDAHRDPYCSVCSYSMLQKWSGCKSRSVVQPSEYRVLHDQSCAFVCVECISGTRFRQQTMSQYNVIWILFETTTAAGCCRFQNGKWKIKNPWERNLRDKESRSVVLITEICMVARSTGDYVCTLFRAICQGFRLSVIRMLIVTKASPLSLSDISLSIAIRVSI